MQSSTDNSQRRPVRSYVIRTGRYTDAQRQAIARHWQDYVLDYHPTPALLEEAFPNPGPLTLEIGFGMGDSLLTMARQTPDSHFLGIEVHKPGIGKLLHGLNEHRVNNVRILCHDATEVVANCLATATVDRFLILFPDPWPKKRHHKRRIVQADFAALLADRLKPGGRLHLATDWQPYAEHMLEVLEACPSLQNASGPNQYWPEPDRPVTKFERRGQRLGHGVWDLLYQRV